MLSPRCDRGVDILTSSGSSCRIRLSSSSELLLEASDVKAFVEAIDLGMNGRSKTKLVGHVPPMLILGSSCIDRCIEDRRDGIMMPFCVMVGEESGEDWSTSVEWWRLVQAREKSSPLEWRGSIVDGFSNTSLASRSTRPPVPKCRRGMYWNKASAHVALAVEGLFRGVGMMTWSSPALRGSLNMGDGKSSGAESDSDLFLVGVRDMEAFWNAVREESVSQGLPSLPTRSPIVVGPRCA